MKQENCEVLKKQLFYKGYKNDLDNDLQANVDKGEQQFLLVHSTSFGKDEMQSTLRYDRSEQGNYFLNKVNVELKRENGEVLNTGFYMDKNSDYTVKQMYNLLSGRFVEKEKETKEKQTYRSWDQLDLTQRDKYDNFPVVSYGERYGFNLSERLDKEPLLANRNTEDRKLLETALKRGNLEKVTYEVNGANVDKYIFANVKMRQIERYDSIADYNRAMAEKVTGRSVSENSQRMPEDNGVGQEQGVKERDKPKKVENTDTSDGDGPGGLKDPQKKSRKRGLKV